MRLIQHAEMAKEIDKRPERMRPEPETRRGGDDTLRAFSDGLDALICPVVFGQLSKSINCLLYVFNDAQK